MLILSIEIKKKKKKIKTIIKIIIIIIKRNNDIIFLIIIFINLKELLYKPSILSIIFIKFLLFNHFLIGKKKILIIT